MADDTVEARIKLQLDAAAANESIARARTLRGELTEIKGSAATAGSEGSKAFRGIAASVKEAASSVNEFAGNVAKAAAKVALFAGGAVVGTAFAAANTFGQRFEGVDPAATEFVRAQKLVSSAFSDLGEVTAKYLTPVLETAAEGIELLAKFLETLPKPTGKNPLETFITETIPNAIQSASRLAGSVRGLAALFERDAGNAIDTFLTNVRKFGLDIAGIVQNLVAQIDKFLRGLFEIIPEGLRQQLGLPGIEVTRSSFGNARSTNLPTSVQKDQLDEELAARIAGRNQVAKAVGDSLAQTDEQVTTTIRNVKNKLDEAFGPNGSLKKSILDNNLFDKSTVDASIARSKSMQAAQKQHDEARLQLDNQFKTAQAKIATERAKLAEDQRAAETELSAKHAADSLKAEQDFQDSEADIEAKGRLKRLQDTRAHEQRLSDFAADRDVLGFIREQNAFKAQTQAEDEQAAQDKQQRGAEYQKQRAERDSQYTKDLADLRKSGREKAQALDEQFRELQANYRSQKTALDNKLAQETQAINDNFVQQLFSLDSHLAGMDALRDAYYARETAALQAFVNSGGLGAAGNQFFSGGTPSYNTGSAFTSAQTSTIYNALQSAGLTTNVTVNAYASDIMTSRDMHALSTAVESGLRSAAARSA